MSRRATPYGTVRWSFRLDKATYEQFQKLHPVQGTTSGVISIALELFLDRVETDPMLLKWARSDIQRKLYDERLGSERHHLPVSIPVALYERFTALFPEFGSTTWFLYRVYTSYLETARPLRDVVAQSLEAIYTRDNQPVSSLPVDGDKYE